jgi:UTP--glucose-1-phosphate uridylyltransferase
MASSLAVGSQKVMDALSVPGAGRKHGKSLSSFAFDNTSTSVAASQMRNALNKLADSVEDPNETKKFATEMDNFFALFRRYLQDKAKGTTLCVAFGTP